MAIESLGPKISDVRYTFSSVDSSTFLEMYVKLYRMTTDFLFLPNVLMVT